MNTIYRTQDIDREFRTAIQHGADTDEVRLARALFDVNAIEPHPHNVAHALNAAAIINRRGLMPSQIRRLYGSGGSTYDYVTEAVAATR